MCFQITSVVSLKTMYGEIPEGYKYGLYFFLIDYRN